MRYGSCAITLYLLFTILNQTAHGQTCTTSGQYTVTTWSPSSMIGVAPTPPWATRIMPRAR